MVDIRTCMRLQPNNSSSSSRRSSSVTHSSSSSLSSSPHPSNSMVTSSVGDSYVFLQESAFGSFDSPANPSSGLQREYLLRGKSSSSSWSSRLSSTASDSSGGRRQASIRLFLRRSLHLIKGRPYSTSSSLDQDGPMLHLVQVKEGLLQVYTFRSLPKEGVFNFHQKLHSVVLSGHGFALSSCWRDEVVPLGTLSLASFVANPKDGDRMSALLTAWSLVYTQVLPLLLALLAPLNSLDVRGEVLSAFRDTMLSYIDLDLLCNSSSTKAISQSWQLGQMLLVLARLGPCLCPVDSLTGILQLNELEEETRVEDGKEPEVASCLKKGSQVEMILEKLLASQLTRQGVTPAVLNHLLHLHHGPYNLNVRNYEPYNISPRHFGNNHHNYNASTHPLDHHHHHHQSYGTYTSKSTTHLISSGYRKKEVVASPEFFQSLQTLDEVFLG